MADGATTAGILGTVGAAIVAAAGSIYKAADIDGKIVKLTERVTAAEATVLALTTSVSEARAFVQSEIQKLDARATRRSSGTLPGVATLDALRTGLNQLAERLVAVEEWVRDKDEAEITERALAERKSERDQLAAVLAALQELAARSGSGKRGDHE